jgi:hypothetical protein
MSRAELNLVVSLCSGLGSHQVLDDGRRVYVKDSDCLGGSTCARGRRADPAARLARSAALEPALPSWLARWAVAPSSKLRALLGLRGRQGSGNRPTNVPSPAAACLKDLQRCLRRDDPDTRDVFFKLGEFDTAKNDLVPIIVTYPDDTDLVYNARAWPQMRLGPTRMPGHARQGWLVSHSHG